jgi:hypothetical protein
MMQMEIDKSEDELDLERLVFGDTEGIKERIRGEEILSRYRYNGNH